MTPYVSSAICRQVNVTTKQHKHDKNALRESVVFLAWFLVVGVTGVNIHFEPSTSMERHNTFERQHLQLAIDHSDIYFARPLNVLPLSQHLRKIAPINDTRVRRVGGQTHNHTHTHPHNTYTQENA